MSKVKRNIKSSFLEKYAEQANKWLDHDLNTARKEFEKILADPKLDEESRSDAMFGVKKAKTTIDLVKHFYNLLLKFEKYGVIK